VAREQRGCRSQRDGISRSPRAMRQRRPTGVEQVGLTPVQVARAKSCMTPSVSASSLGGNLRRPLSPNALEASLLPTSDASYPPSERIRSSTDRMPTNTATSYSPSRSCGLTPLPHRVPARVASQAPGGCRLTRREARALQVGVYQSAWTTVPPCSVATVAFSVEATTAPRSSQLFIASCQCRATPAGDS
jgi:hypothetical protein